MAWFIWRRHRPYSLVGGVRWSVRRRSLWNAVKLPLVMVLLTMAGLYISARVLWRRGSVPANLSRYPDGQEIRDHVFSPMNPDELLFRPPLHTLGRNIVDSDGDRLKLISVNWYGASDIFMVPGGLDVQNRSQIARTIRELGFNSVRLPYADEIVVKNPIIDANHLTANQDLIGRRALDVYAAVVQALTGAGLGVIVNNHITQARWCCDGYPCDMSWANNDLGPLCPVKQSEEDWIQHLQTVMRPHIHDPLVVGVDLRNEVRGFAGRLMWDGWATAAEHAAERLHQLQSEWLIIVEGVQSANDIRGAKDRPVNLRHPGKLVYSSHVYGWSGWGSLVPYWYRTYQSFAEDMDNNWGYLRKTDSAPVWVGEIGAPGHPARRDYHYWKNLMAYLRETDVDIAYWALNPRKPEGNAVESYGLLEDDWKTPIYDYRLWDISRLRPTHVRAK